MTIKLVLAAKHAALRSKNVDWLARNHYVSKWSDMFTFVVSLN